jgi:hypothetical protein
MKVQYRIANRNGNYYPHVKIKKFLFWSNWKKIAEHLTGYGMYRLPNTDYPKTKNKCEQIIKDFDAWFKIESTVNESYSNFYCD